MPIHAPPVGFDAGVLQWKVVEGLDGGRLLGNGESWREGGRWSRSGLGLVVLMERFGRLAVPTGAMSSVASSQTPPLGQPTPLGFFPVGPC